jgi:hypothetical protein
MDYGLVPPVLEPILDWSHFLHEAGARVSARPLHARLTRQGAYGPSAQSSTTFHARRNMPKLFYARVLRLLPLNVAQSYAAAQFIAVILASKLILGEPIPLARWAGISLIAAGIIVGAWQET